MDFCSSEMGGIIGLRHWLSTGKLALVKLLALSVYGFCVNDSLPQIYENKFINYEKVFLKEVYKSEILSALHK